MRTMSTKIIQGWLPLIPPLLLAACSSNGPNRSNSTGTAHAESELRRLVVDGQELHSSLITWTVDSAAALGSTLAFRENPRLSADPEFVEVIARGSSQGRLDREGIREALYALYVGEGQVGVYGLRAASLADADCREGQLRGIWAHSASVGRSRVHREGTILVVVWHHGVSPECWEAVNTEVVKRLNTPE